MCVVWCVSFHSGLQKVNFYTIPVICHSNALIKGRKYPLHTEGWGSYMCCIIEAQFSEQKLNEQNFGEWKFRGRKLRMQFSSKVVLSCGQTTETVVME